MLSDKSSAKRSERDPSSFLEKRSNTLVLHLRPYTWKMEPDEQPRPDEIREFVSNEAPNLSEASADQIAAAEDQETGNRSFSG